MTTDARLGPGQAITRQIGGWVTDLTGCSPLENATSFYKLHQSSRNGGRKVEDLIHHIGTDTLVGWAWAPGFGRTPAPGTQKEAGALVDAWIKTGAVCPAR